MLKEIFQNGCFSIFIVLPINMINQYILSLFLPLKALQKNLIPISIIFTVLN